MLDLRHFAVLIVLFVGAFVPPAAAESAQPPPSGEMVALELVALEGAGLGGEIEWLDVTAEHPFWVRDEDWIEAGDLLPGDELFTSAGGWARVSGATWAEVEAAVYNPDVEGWDSYFVGEGRYWVHNADCPRGLAAGGAARGGAGVVRVGQAGEAAVRSVADIGEKALIRVGGRGRILDGLTSTVLSEVKNVSSLSYTQQLRDFATYASQRGLRFDLWVRPTTQTSGPLLDAF